MVPSYIFEKATGVEEGIGNLDLTPSLSPPHFLALVMSLKGMFT